MDTGRSNGRSPASPASSDTGTPAVRQSTATVASRRPYLPLASTSPAATAFRPASFARCSQTPGARCRPVSVRPRLLPILLLGVLAVGSPEVGAAPLGGHALTQVASGLPGAVFVAPAPLDVPDRLYVVRKNGLIVTVDAGRALTKPFLDLRGEVAGGELRGLFSV